MGVSNTALIVAEVADRHESEKCLVLMPGYKHDDASVQQMQEYAGCVDRLYPINLSPSDVVVIKVLIVAAFIGFVIGAIKGDDFFERVMFGFLGGLSAPVVLGLFVAAIQFLFS